MKKTDPSLYRPMLAAAVRGAASLPPAERADVYAGIAAVTAPFDPKTSENARELATAIRDSEGLQLHFKTLFEEKA